MVLEQDREALPSPRQSRMISKVLSPAVRLWLRSQVDSVEELQFQIEGGDRQILTGHIPRVSIAAHSAVYQGLHLSQICLSGEEIRVNLGQVLKGKPLRLLSIVPVSGEAMFREPDLNCSLQVPSLADGLAELLMGLLQSQPAIPTPLAKALEDPLSKLQNLQVRMGQGQLTLCADLVSATCQPLLLILRTGLCVNGNAQLQLEHPELLPHLEADQGFSLTHLHGFEVNLGSEVALEELTLEEQRITCRGRINVIPAGDERLES